MDLLRSGLTKQIVVDRAAVRANQLEPGLHPKRPVVLVYVGGRRYLAAGVEIAGPCRVVYRPDAPLKACGSTVWLETEAAVEISHCTTA